jgi:tetratricopeptide (TPR) repeat protein
LEEYNRFARAALGVLEESRHPRETGLLLHHVSNSALGAEGISAGEQAVKIFEDLDDSFWTARCLSTLGWVLFLTGHGARAIEVLDRATVIYRASGLTNSIWFAEVLRNSSILSIEQGEFDVGRSSLKEAIDIGLVTGRKQFVLGCRINLGELELLTGHPEAALEIADAALQAARETGIKHYESIILNNRAAYRFALNDIEGARLDALAALQLTGRDNPRLLNTILRLFARIAAITGNVPAAVRLAGFIVANIAAMGIAFHPTDLASFEKWLASVRSQLSDDKTFTLLEAAGAQLTLDAAVEEALSLAP